MKDSSKTAPTRKTPRNFRTKSQVPPPPGQILLTTAQMAHVVGYSEESLRLDRYRDRLFPYLQIGRTVRYDREAVLAKLRTFQSQGVMPAPSGAFKKKANKALASAESATEQVSA